MSSNINSTPNSELQKKLESILLNPNCNIFYSTFRDFDRDFKYDLSNVSRMIFPPIRFKNIAKRTTTSFTYGRHLTFADLYDCDPNKQKMQIALNFYNKSKSRQLWNLPSFYANAYYIEYGKKSSFWTVAHIKDFMSDKTRFHGLSMFVMVDAIKRKKIAVIPHFKEACDNNNYPKELKPKYNELKSVFINDLQLLNKLRKETHKSLIYSCPIQLRYGDEDINHHLNVETYMRYAYEGLINYDKRLKNNQKVIYCMSNVYWNEIRMNCWNHCYCNIWNIIKCKTSNGIDVELYVGTIDIDKTYCKMKDNKRCIQEVDNHKHEWIHYHGFVAGVVDVKNLKKRNSKL